MDGKLSISRFTGTDGKCISIELSDELSGTRVVTIILTAEQFGDAVTGLGYTDCNFTLSPAMNLVGKRRESKREWIEVQMYPSDYSDAEIRKILARYEVDGWLARDSDFKNGHNFKNGHVSVAFVRYLGD